MFVRCVSKMWSGARDVFAKFPAAFVSLDLVITNSSPSFIAPTRRLHVVRAHFGTLGRSGELAHRLRVGCTIGYEGTSHNQ